MDTIEMKRKIFEVLSDIAPEIEPDEVDHDESLREELERSQVMEQGEGEQLDLESLTGDPDDPDVEEIDESEEEGVH